MSPKFLWFEDWCNSVAPYFLMQFFWDEERSVGMISYADLPHGVRFFWRWELLFQSWMVTGWCTQADVCW